MQGGRRRSVFAGVGGMVAKSATPRRPKSPDGEDQRTADTAEMSTPDHKIVLSDSAQRNQLQQELSPVSKSSLGDELKHHDHESCPNSQEKEESVAHQSYGAPVDSPAAVKGLEYTLEVSFASTLKGDVDWSSFPLFPLEQIALLGPSELHKTDRALEELLVPMMENTSLDPTEAGLFKYAQRERLEITRRLEALEASARVANLLQSTAVPNIADLCILRDEEMPKQSLATVQLEETKQTKRSKEPSHSSHTSNEEYVGSLRRPSPIESHANSSQTETIETFQTSCEAKDPIYRSDSSKSEHGGAPISYTESDGMATKPAAPTGFENGRTENSYLKAKKMSQSARRAIVSNAKEFVVFAETSRREKRLQQEEQRARMLARARAKAKKKRREEKREHLEKLREARQKLKEREEARARWEQERQERVLRAEAMAKEMRKRGLDTNLRSARSSTSSHHSHRDTKYQEEEEDEDVVALEEAIEEEKAANEDSHDRQSAQMAATENKIPNDHVDGEDGDEDEDDDDDGEDDEDDDRGNIETDNLYPCVDAKNMKPAEYVANKPRETNLQSIAKDLSGNHSCDSQSQDPEILSKLENKASNMEHQNINSGEITRISKLETSECQVDQSGMENSHHVENHFAASGIKNLPNAPQNHLGNYESTRARVENNSIEVLVTESSRPQKLNLFSPNSTASDEVVPGPLDERLQPISPISGIESEDPDEFLEQMPGPRLHSHETTRSGDPKVEKLVLNLSQSKAKTDEIDVNARSNVNSYAPAEKESARSTNSSRTRRSNQSRQSSARSTLSQKESLLNQLRQDMLNVKKDIEADLSNFRTDIDCVSDDDSDDMLNETESERDNEEERPTAKHNQTIKKRQSLQRHDNNVLRKPQQKFDSRFSEKPDESSKTIEILKDEEKVSLRLLPAEPSFEGQGTPVSASSSTRRTRRALNKSRSRSGKANEGNLQQSSSTQSGLSNTMEAIVAPCISQRVLEGLGGIPVDYSEYFSSFGDIFTVYNAKDTRKTNKLKVLEAVLEETLETFQHTNKALTLELCNDNFEEWVNVGANRFFRVLSKSRHEVFNIVRDAALNLDTLGVEESLVRDKLRETFTSTQPITHNSITARTPMSQLPAWAGPVWNLLWTWSKPKIDRNTLLSWQRVNHFSSARSLTRKDLLKQELHRYRSMSKYLSAAFELLPDTFILPKEYLQFVDAFAKYSELDPDGNFWIMKPVGLSRGRGISLVSDIGDVCYGQSVIIQRYVSNPMLLDGYKFDLRIYVLVTSFDPLEAWIYDEGFVRVCTHKYSSASIDLHNLFIHLTNSSIQKMGPNGSGTKATAESISRHQAAIDEAGGTKLSLTYLWRRLRAQGHDVDAIQKSIQKLILKSLVCCDESMSSEPNSFELFGYDVLLDENARPWLIEINSSPSLAQENQLDSKVKRKLIADTLRLVNPLEFNRVVLLEVLQRRREEMEENRVRPFKQSAANRDSERQRLDRELTAILHGKRPRKLGEEPEDPGLYKLLCPNTAVHEEVMQIIRQDRQSGGGGNVRRSMPKAQRAAAPAATTSASGRGLEYLAQGCNVKL